LNSKGKKVGLTDGGLAEILVGDFRREVGAHEHAAGDVEVLRDDVRDETDAAALGLVEALDEREADGRRLDLAHHGFAQAADELVGNHEDQHVRVLGRLHNVGHGDLHRNNGKKCYFHCCHFF
jgi:hypothetical protein